MTHTIDGVIITPEILGTLKDLQQDGVQLRLQCIERLTDFILDYEAPTNNAEDILGLVRDCRYLKEDYISFDVKGDNAE